MGSIARLSRSTWRRWRGRGTPTGGTPCQTLGRWTRPLRHSRYLFYSITDEGSDQPTMITKIAKVGYHYIYLYNSNILQLSKGLEISGDTTHTHSQTKWPVEVHSVEGGGWPGGGWPFQPTSPGLLLPKFARPERGIWVCMGPASLICCLAISGMRRELGRAAESNSLLEQIPLIPNFD